MVRANRPPTRPQAGNRLLAIFCLTILLPGLVLAVFGVHALWQERRFASQQVRDRLDLAAEIAARELERAISPWQTVVEQLGRGHAVDLTHLPDHLRAPFEDPGTAAIVVAAERALWPRTQMLHRLDGDQPVARRTPPVLAAAEAAELSGDHLRAERLYRHALTAADAGTRPLVLHRVARTLRKAGRRADALVTYRELLTSTAPIGALPADLIARYEICSLLAEEDAPDLANSALDFYRNLVAGHWTLERSRYAFYATSSREWARRDAVASDELAHWTAVEDRKAQLLKVATLLLDTTPSQLPGAQDGYVIIQSHGGPAVMLLSRRWVETDLLPQQLGTALTDVLHIEVSGRSGEVLFASGTPPAGGAVAPRGADAPALLWRLRVWPRDPAAFSADLARRQTLYLIMLSLVVTLLAFGTYLTSRVVKRELEIARLKSDFVSTVSHEFRSPLTGIRQLGELLMRGRVTSEEKRQQYYERITSESDRLSRLVENLLDFARMEEGRKDYRFEPLDTATWLQALVQDARAQHAGDGTQIVATIPSSLPPLVADPSALASALHNLIDNAIKYSPGRDTIWVDAEAADRQVTIRVRDAGLGITEDERRHMFEKFYRGRGEITRQVKGAGLGLSLVHHIVTAHGGTVACEGRPGEGTTFSIHLAAAANLAAT
jgi:signal transduction histidine kinase